MASETSNNGWGSYEKLVLDKLDTIQATHEKFLEKFDAHTEDDRQRFEAIGVTLATQAGAHEATAKTQAKLWALIGGAITFVGTTLVHIFYKQ